ncbi:MAG: glycoside hydrolase family 95-like protein [Melioribacteraceae bacterium]
MPPNKFNRVKHSLILLLLLLNDNLHFAQNAETSQNLETGFPNSKHDLCFKLLPVNWDEGFPLGNGMIGALIWKRENSLRISLDRADLWDSRTPGEFERPEFDFAWVAAQVNKNDYGIVQKLFDEPYDREAYPTKLPAAAIEFEIPNCEQVESAGILLKNAVCVIKWRSGIKMTSFIHATEPYGWFKLEGVSGQVIPKLSPPPYNKIKSGTTFSDSGPAGNDLSRLGYKPPVIKKEKNQIVYHQECADGFSYDVSISWIYSENTLLGKWTVVPDKSYPLYNQSDSTNAELSLNIFDDKFNSHRKWWNNFWSKSSIEIPDSILEVQYYRDIYKFGSSSRKGTPPITLQAIWTADNGKLPPWKGDFHNDLNTQMSYWPGYTANLLEESSAFTDWLWNCRPAAEEYTKKYFKTAGLNFPGVSTLDGKPMGGWIQYSLGPTVSAWLAHHFYLQWRYSLDKNFLAERAYLWIKDVAVYLDQISMRDEKGNRKLPLSSSPEINDNSINAWFKETTNFDLSLIRWLYGAAYEMAEELKLKNDMSRWKMILNEWPDLAVSETDKLLVSPGFDLIESHRHFSHLMSIFPLGLLKWEDPSDRNIIVSSLKDLERLGTDWWCGYSFSWLGNLYARAKNGEKAAEALKIFSECFCLPNSFHVNGDQSNSGKSKFTYRPFTLEGNFAFASGILEMLLQSHNGIIRIFPAIPWPNASFRNLRSEGAFLISAEKKEDKIKRVTIYSEKGGLLKMEIPFGKTFRINGNDSYQFINDVGLIVLKTGIGELIEITN